MRVSYRRALRELDEVGHLLDIRRSESINTLVKLGEAGVKTDGKLSLHLDKPNTDVCKELRELESNSVKVIVDVPVGGSKFGHC